MSENAQNPTAPIAHALPGSSSGAGGDKVSLPSATGSSSGNVERFYCAQSGLTLKSHKAAGEYDFRLHPDMVSFLERYAHVVLVEVSVFVFQTRIVSSSSVAHHPIHLRFGIAPRSINHTKTTKTKGKDAEGKETITVESTGLGHLFPTFEDLVSTVNTGSFRQVTWASDGVPGSNRLPFPDGVQTDLRMPELVHNYATFLATQTNPSTSYSENLWSFQISFAVDCYGRRFPGLTTTA